MSDSTSHEPAFADLLRANEVYTRTFDLQGFDGVARAGVAVVTCMDSRLDPLGMIGLRPGDAKIFRNPGGRVNQPAMEALILGAHLLNVDRILVIEHTRCAVATHDEATLQAMVGESAGQDASWQNFPVVTDQRGTLRSDVMHARAHPLLPEHVRIGGFLYDVDTGRLEQII